MYTFNMHLFVDFDEKAKQYNNTVLKYTQHWKTFDGEQLPIEELLLLWFAQMHNSTIIAEAQ